MNRFAPLLQQASVRLDLPQPTKSRILLEMAGDLEDVFQHHLAKGLDETEAARRAEEAFAITDDNLRHLVMIHKNTLDRFGDAVAGQAGTWWEKLLLFLLLGFVLLLAGGGAWNTSLLANANVFVWPVLGLGAIAFLVALWKLSQLVRSQDFEVRHFRRGLWTLLFLAGATLTTGFFGFFLGLVKYARVLAETPNLKDANPASARWLVQTAEMMNVTMLTSILIAIVWFVLVNLVARIERRRADKLIGA